MTRLRSTVIWWLFLPSCSTLVRANDAIVLEIDAGDHDRITTPISFELPESLKQHKSFQLERVQDGQRIETQLTVSEQTAWLVWLLQKPLPAKQSRRYRLIPTQPRGTNNTVSCQDRDGQLLIRVGHLPVLQYNRQTVQAPDGIKSLYRRSGYIHPLFNPAGQSITGDFAEDHPHQHGIFFAWVNTSFAGREVDFWNQAKQQAIIQHVEMLGELVSGPVFAEFTARLTHSLASDNDPVPVLDETWTVRVYNVREYFLFDLVSVQRCATDEPVRINQYHYGGMAIRGNSDWFDSSTSRRVQQAVASGAGAAELAKIEVKRDYLTSQGKTWVDGNATRARWVQMHGIIEEQPTGVTIMGHPSNFRSPQTVRLHPTKPYFCFAPMILGDFEIRPETSYTSMYRYHVHLGPTDDLVVRQLWNDYAFPVVAQVVTKSPLTP